MSVNVEDVLELRRKGQGRHGVLAALLTAVLLHAGGLAAAVFGSHKEPAPLEIVSVQIVPAQALGSPRPRQPAKPEPEPEPPAPEPEEEAPAAEDEDLPVLPDPEREPEEPASTPPPAEPAAPSSGSAPEVREGSPRGNPAGASPFGAEVASVDADFRYDYYIQRMLSLIRSNWVRPPAGSEIRAVIHFRIQRNGEITELRVEETSSLEAFDLAALRAVQNSSPLPRLPASYRRDSLGVTLIVR